MSKPFALCLPRFLFVCFFYWFPRASKYTQNSLAFPQTLLLRRRATEVWIIGTPLKWLFSSHRDSHSEEGKRTSEQRGHTRQFSHPGQWKDQGLCPVLSVGGGLQTLPHRCIRWLLQLPGCGPAAARHPGRFGGIPQGEATYILIYKTKAWLGIQPKSKQREGAHNSPNNEEP